MKAITFIQNQIDQIKEGGKSVIWQKIIQISGRFFIPILGAIAVRFKINWPEAYDYVIDKRTEMFFDTRHTSIPKDKRDELESKAEGLLKEYIAIKPTLKNMPVWLKTNERLALLYFCRRDFEGYIHVYQKAEEVRKSVLKDYQLDDIGFEFVPQTTATGSIGKFENLNMYIMAGILDKRPMKKKILLLPPGMPISNACYLNHWKKYITIIDDPKTVQTLRPLEACLTVPFHYCVEYQNKVFVSHIALGIVQEDWDKANRLPLISLSGKDCKRGWQSLENLGVPRDAWFVCLHVREEGWHKKETVEEEYRNGDINTYLPAIESITSQGGWVIRMGDSTMQPLPDMPQVIDYANSNAKSDWMDVFLCAQCRFMIGTSSGLFMISVAFGVPSVLTNFLPGFATFCLSEKDLFLPGLCRSKKDGQLLTFKELLSPPVGVACEQFDYDALNIEVVKNTSEEIKGLIEEMLDRCNGKSSYTDDDEKLQSSFKEMASQCGNAYGDQRVAINARIGRCFLRKYSKLLAQGEEVLSSLE